MIIVLNGCSSAGKSSLARALKTQLPEYYYIAVDAFLQPILPHGFDGSKQEHGLKLLDAVSAFNESLGIYASHIDDFILDHVLESHESQLQVARALHRFPSFCVQVYAPLKVLEQREAERIERAPGLAYYQFDSVYSMPFDLKVETHRHSPEECALAVMRALKPGQALAKIIEQGH